MKSSLTTIALSIQDLLPLTCPCTGITPAYGLFYDDQKSATMICGLPVCIHSHGVFAAELLLDIAVTCAIQAAPALTNVVVMVKAYHGVHRLTFAGMRRVMIHVQHNLYG